MFCDWITTGITAKAVWMKESPHASQVVAIANFPVAATAYSEVTARIISKITYPKSCLHLNVNITYSLLDNSPSGHMEQEELEEHKAGMMKNQDHHKATSLDHHCPPICILTKYKPHIFNIKQVNLNSSRELHSYAETNVPFGLFKSSA